MTEPAHDTTRRPNAAERYRRLLAGLYGRDLHDLAEVPILAVDLRELVALAETAEAETARLRTSARHVAKIAMDAMKENIRLRAQLAELGDEWGLRTSAHRPDDARSYGRGDVGRWKARAAQQQWHVLVRRQATNWRGAEEPATASRPVVSAAEFATGEPLPPDELATYLAAIAECRSDGAADRADTAGDGLSATQTDDEAGSGTETGSNWSSGSSGAEAAAETHGGQGTHGGYTTHKGDRANCPAPDCLDAEAACERCGDQPCSECGECAGQLCRECRCNQRDRDDASHKEIED